MAQNNKPVNVDYFTATPKAKYLSWKTMRQLLYNILDIKAWSCFTACTVPFKQPLDLTSQNFCKSETAPTTLSKRMP